METVVGSGIGLHVEGFGHVAFDATIACAAGSVMAVCSRFDNGCAHQAVFVTAQAELIVLYRQDVLHGVGIVAIHAGHSDVGHATHTERSMNEDFFEDLTVVVIETGLGRCGEGEVIFVEVSGLKGIGGYLIAAGMATGAVVLRLHVIESFHLRPLITSFCGLDMFCQSVVAFRAGDTLLRPGGFVAVVCEVVVLLVFGGMAVGAVGVPVHSLAGPVPPFAREPILPAVDVVPLVFPDVVGSANSLYFIAGENSEVLADGSLADNANELVGFAYGFVFEDFHDKGSGLLAHAIEYAGLFDHAGGAKGGAIEFWIERTIGFGVVAAHPGIDFIGVAFHAGFRADCLHACGVVAEWEGGELLGFRFRCFFTVSIRAGACAECEQGSCGECRPA